MSAEVNRILGVIHRRLAENREAETAADIDGRNSSKFTAKIEAYEDVLSIVLEPDRHSLIGSGPN